MAEHAPDLLKNLMAQAMLFLKKYAMQLNLEI